MCRDLALRRATLTSDALQSFARHNPGLPMHPGPKRRRSGSPRDCASINEVAVLLAGLEAPTAAHGTMTVAKALGTLGRLAAQRRLWRQLHGAL